MRTDDPKYSLYISLLKKELIPAAGCTEPAALAYAAALARKELGAKPDRVLVEVSANIIKNVKSVVVPNTGGLKGIKAAAAAGIVAGASEKKLEVISVVSEKQREELRRFLAAASIEARLADSEKIFDITVTLWAGKDYAKVRLADSHTNVVLIERNGKIIFSLEEENSEREAGQEAEINLDVRSIVDFADTVRLEDVKTLIERQIAYNKAISDEGLKGNYGANIGKTFRKTYGNDIRIRAKAAAAAGSDARMGGSEMPVIIVSGSGNQGMTASLPVIEYAEELGKSRESLIRSLVAANLVAIHLKKGIGRLSAYCGAVSAGAAAGAGIAYLHNGQLEGISKTIINALAAVSGIVCDGAKPSCAAKIAAAVDAGILGFEMFNNDQQFSPGEGIVADGVEHTIENVSRLGREGMKMTDKEIISIMLEL
jgi:L-cysteine desulfidase